MSTMRRKAILFVALIIGGAACGIGGAALGGFLLSGCAPAQQPKPLVAPNPNGVDCLTERQMLQLTCVQHYSTGAAIDKCIADAKLPDCTTEAGVAAFITSRDAGAADQ